MEERKGPGGLMEAAWLDGFGVMASRNFLLDSKPNPANALGVTQAWGYSYTREGESHPASVAARLALFNPGTEPWTLAGAALVYSTGEEVALAVWEQAPIPPGPTGGLVVVGTERAPEQLGCPCTLKLWEAGGPRTVTVGDVKFPAVSPARR